MVCISPCGTDFIAFSGDVKGVTSSVAVDTVAQMPSIASAYNGKAVCDALSVLIAGANVDVNWSRHTNNLEVHAPTVICISPCRADLIPVVAANCDLESISGLMGVDAVAEVSCIIGTNHGNGRRHALRVAVGVINEHMNNRSCGCDVTGLTATENLGGNALSASPGAGWHVGVVNRASCHSRVVAIAVHRGIGEAHACIMLVAPRCAVRFGCDVVSLTAALQSAASNVRATLSPLCPTLRADGRWCLLGWDAELWIFCRMISAEIVGSHSLSARRTGPAVVEAASHAHLRASVVRPLEGCAHLRVIRRDAHSNGVQEKDRLATIGTTRMLHAAIFTSQAELRILGSVIAVAPVCKGNPMLACQAPCDGLIPATHCATLQAASASPFEGCADLRVVVGHCTEQDVMRVFHMFTTLCWLGTATLLWIWSQRGVAFAELWELDGMLVAEMLGVEATLTRDASHIVEVTTDNVLFMAAVAIPHDAVADLVVIVCGTQAACTLHGHVGAFGWRRLHAAMLAHVRWTGKRIFDKVSIAELVRMDTFHACQASDIVGVKGRAAVRVHLEASVMRPIEHNSNLRVVGRDAIADCSDELNTVAPVGRVCNAALLADRWTTKVGVLLAVKVTEVVRTDLLHACCTLQGVPIAAHGVGVMASSAGPHNLRAHLPVVPSEAVSQCDGVMQ